MAFCPDRAGSTARNVGSGRGAQTVMVSSLALSTMSVLKVCDPAANGFCW